MKHFDLRAYNNFLIQKLILLAVNSGFFYSYLEITNNSPKSILNLIRVLGILNPG